MPEFIAINKSSFGFAGCHKDPTGRPPRNQLQVKAVLWKPLPHLAFLQASPLLHSRAAVGGLAQLGAPGTCQGMVGP